MSAFDNCFIMLCNKRTEAECISRGLFGDKEWRLDYLRDVKPGDLGFLLNTSTDQLIGPFRACSQAELDIQADAWLGRFRAQVRVEAIEPIRRVNSAAVLLDQAGIALDQVSSGARVPLLPVQSGIVAEMLLKVMRAHGASES